MLYQMLPMIRMMWSLIYLWMVYRQFSHYRLHFSKFPQFDRRNVNEVSERLMASAAVFLKPKNPLPPFLLLIWHLRTLDQITLPSSHVDVLGSNAFRGHLTTVAKVAASNSRSCMLCFTAIRFLLIDSIHVCYCREGLIKMHLFLRLGQELVNISLVILFCF